jgi:hypothetical protein
MKLLRTIAALVLFNSAAFACSCRWSDDVHRYLKAANVVFVGKVVFSNDHGSGTFVQRTLVHFDVEETLKGLDPAVRDAWIDPGSLTSCYAEYPRGGRYLVFAYNGASMPVGTAAMTVADPRGKTKPIPPGIDPAHPPIMYIAPECSGTLEIQPSTDKVVNGWLKQLRHYREHEAKPSKTHKE